MPRLAAIRLGWLTPFAVSLCALLGALADSATGQVITRQVDGRSQTTIQFGHPDEHREIRFTTQSVPGSTLGGGYTYFDVVLTNADMEVDAHDIEIEAKIEGFNGVLHARATTALTLGKGERRTVTLPLANVRGLGCHVRVRVDGVDAHSRVSVVSGSKFGSILLLTDDSEWTKAWTFAPRQAQKGKPGRPSVTIGRRHGRSRSVSHNVAVIERDLNELPDRWQWLTGISWIAVDGRTQNLEPVRQTLLLDWLAAGGSMVVTHSDALTSGPLRTKLGNVRRAGGTVAGRHGFGRFYATAGAALVDGKFTDTLDAWLRDDRNGLGPFSKWKRIGPIPTPFKGAQPIPSLGEPPVTLFFVLIVSFVLLAGPLNYLWAARKKQPVLMAFTVPALGLAFTAGILLWGVLSEGFGTRGTIQSITCLDQRTAEAIRMTNRTLYAASTPGNLTPAATTWLGNGALNGPRQSSAAVLDQHLADGQITFSGRAVPARTETPLWTIENTTARERLRFKRSGDGYEVIADSEFSPAPTAGSIVLRTDAGYFRSDASGRLQPVAAPTSFDDRAELLTTIIQQLSKVERSPEVAAADVADWLRAGLGDRMFAQWVQPLLTLPPNSYVAIVNDLPSLDGLGLSIDYERENHVVIGQLAKDDLDG